MLLTRTVDTVDAVDTVDTVGTVDVFTYIFIHLYYIYILILKFYVLCGVQEFFFSNQIPHVGVQENFQIECCTLGTKKIRKLGGIRRKGG